MARGKHERETKWRKYDPRIQDVYFRNLFCISLIKLSVVVVSNPKELYNAHIFRS